MSSRSRRAVKRLRRILHATDFSKASARALTTAAELARRDGARLLLLHVLVPASPFVAGEAPPSSYLELQRMARRDAARRLAAAVARAKQVGAQVQGKLVAGAPAETILRMTRRWRPDMVVIGTHGRSGLGRLLMGSVAERVVQRSPHPVLTVRGR